MIRLKTLLEKKKKNFENVSWPQGMENSQCSLGEDDDGYFAYTHRARSSSYPTPEEIPESKIKFIEGTG